MIDRMHRTVGGVFVVAVALIALLPSPAVCEHPSTTLMYELQAKGAYRLRAEYVAQGPAAVDFLCEALRCRSIAIRCFALDTLGRIGDPAAKPALLHALRSWRCQIREAAALALGQMGDKSSVHELYGVTSDPHEGVRAAAAEALGLLGDKGAIPALRDRLKDSHWTVKLSAARALRRLGDRSAIPALIEWATHETEEVRQAAIYELGETRDKSAVPTLVALLNTPAWNVTELSVEAIGTIAAPSTPPTLSELLSDDNVNIRAAVIDALAKIGTPVVVPTLISALEDWDPTVRLKAAKALGDIGDESTREPLTLLLEREGHPAVCVWTAAALCKMGSEDLLDDVTDEIDHQDPLVRASAIHAVAWLRHEPAVPLLVAHLRDESSYVRLASVRALSAMSEGSSRQQLILALNESRFDVRREAFQVLHERYGAKIFDILKAR